MEKTELLSRMKQEGLVAVVRAENKEKGEKVIDAIVKGGINFIEITMTVPGAVDIIKELSEKYKDDKNIVIGAGTVLDTETARMVILAGAQFVVSPSLNPDTVKLCNRYRVPVMPGIMTVKEAVEALELGVDILKVFPGNAFGPSIISSFKGPLPQAQFMPTGGVSVDNVDKWFKAGVVAVGTGSNLTAGAKTGDYDAVTKMAEEFVSAVKKAREE
ncbi:MAG: bifunctional 4-hydroxy-2-oxoglutarate aldolase/2-dehydro-3-deoxy-phosphogluconate aldolase [Clostridia bacterium]|nr:bifunctional 4-hydroxy-2-oxoglutarate aldolase/2-dehydro-3-deoxy-phosphogluconate aldolase [Clostridia bacterium]